jgi:CRISPR type I-E-associated protein CasB/Cse2
MNQTIKKINKSKAFVQRVSQLTAGDLAILRRCNKNPLEDQRIFSVLGKLGALRIYNYALVACLYAVYHREGENPIFLEKYNFGKAFKAAYDPENKKNQDTRFRAILSANKGDALAYRLRQAIRLVKNKEEPVDFSVLLSNLFNWDKHDRWVQRKWAEGYYEGYHEESSLDNETTENSASFDDAENDEE